MNYTKEILYKSKITGTYHKTPEAAESDGYCKCGSIKKTKNSIFCDKCQKEYDNKRADEQRDSFLKLIPQNWDDTVKVVYDENTDTWFNEEYEVLAHYNQEGLNIEDAMLIEGTPNYLSSIEYDYWNDDIAENFTIPAKLEKALCTLNEIAENTIGCYLPDGCRIELSW